MWIQSQAKRTWGFTAQYPQKIEGNNHRQQSADQHSWDSEEGGGCHRQRGQKPKTPWSRSNLCRISIYPYRIWLHTSSLPLIPCLRTAFSISTHRSTLWSTTSQYCVRMKLWRISPKPRYRQKEKIGIFTNYYTFICTRRCPSRCLFRSRRSFQGRPFRSDHRRSKPQSRGTKVPPVSGFAPGACKKGTVTPGRNCFLRKAWKRGVSDFWISSAPQRWDLYRLFGCRSYRCALKIYSKK